MHVTQAAGMTAASTGVQGRQRPSAILNDQALRGLDSTRHPTVRRGRSLQELAVRRIAEVKIRVPGSCRKKRTSRDCLRLQRFDRRTFVHLRRDDRGNGRLAIDANDGFEFAIVGSDRDATPIKTVDFRRD